MLDHWIGNSKFEKKLESFVMRYLAQRVKANNVTILGLIIGIISGLLIYVGNILVWGLLGNVIAGIIMISSFTLDLFDGALARVTKPSLFGGILDIFCDRAVELTILLALASTDIVTLTWPTLFALSAIVLCITIFLLSGSAIKNQGERETKKVIFYTKGIMERGETFLFLFVMTIVPVIRIFLMWIFAILIYVTAFQRLWITRNLLSESKNKIEK